MYTIYNTYIHLVKEMGVSITFLVQLVFLLERNITAEDWQRIDQIGLTGIGQISIFFSFKSVK